MLSQLREILINKGCRVAKGSCNVGTELGEVRRAQGKPVSVLSVGSLGVTARTPRRKKNPILTRC